MAISVARAALTVPPSATSWRLSASPNSELYYKFLRKLAAAFVSPRLPDPGPYKQTFNFNVDVPGMADPNVLLAPLGVGPYSGCNMLACLD